MWNSRQYLQYAAERERPFHDLLARIPTAAPKTVVDLGCGPGNYTDQLAERWPDATVTGVDSSPDMINKARSTSGRTNYVLGDLTAWKPEAPVDVIVTSAALHWVPDHPKLLPVWADALAPGGTLAIQVPGNFSDPTHVILGALTNSPHWRDKLGGTALLRNIVDSAAAYLDLLAPTGLRVDAWETTYEHVLQGPDPVLEWTKGTALRPVLAALSADEQVTFQAEYGALLREAYPARAYGTVLPFRRIFAVAVKED
jgi:trans-aconitate 2-methyltransferase